MRCANGKGSGIYAGPTNRVLVPSFIFSSTADFQSNHGRNRQARHTGQDSTSIDHRGRGLRQHRLELTLSFLSLCLCPMANSRTSRHSCAIPASWPHPSTARARMPECRHPNLANQPPASRLTYSSPSCRRGPPVTLPAPTRERQRYNYTKTNTWEDGESSSSPHRMRPLHTFLS